ncbi:MAG: septation regulator SpoVG [Fibrobacter sp.]|nr:septation regulator SpoVG [Fibrobacter sp.]
MEITEVRIALINESKLRAFVSITFDNCFVVRGIKVIQGPEGLFVSMPSRRTSRGTFQDIAHPIREEMRLKMDKLILEAFQAELRNRGISLTAAD